MSVWVVTQEIKVSSNDMLILEGQAPWEADSKWRLTCRNFIGNVPQINSCWGSQGRRKEQKEKVACVAVTDSAFPSVVLPLWCLCKDVPSWPRILAYVHSQGSLAHKL